MTAASANAVANPMVNPLWWDGIVEVSAEEEASVGEGDDDKVFDPEDDIGGDEANDGDDSGDLVEDSLVEELGEDGDDADSLDEGVGVGVDGGGVGS